MVAKVAKGNCHLKWDSFGLGFGLNFEQWCWLEIGRGLATVNCQDFGSLICFGDVGFGSLDEDWVNGSESLIDPATFDSHFQLLPKVEWIRLKFGLKAIDETFQNPSFAPGAFFESRECGDEMGIWVLYGIRHLTSPCQPCSNDLFFRHKLPTAPRLL